MIKHVKFLVVVYVALMGENLLASLGAIPLNNGTALVPVTEKVLQVSNKVAEVLSYVELDGGWLDYLRGSGPCTLVTKEGTKLGKVFIEKGLLKVPMNNGEYCLTLCRPVYSWTYQACFLPVSVGKGCVKLAWNHPVMTALVVGVVSALAYRKLQDRKFFSQFKEGIARKQAKSKQKFNAGVVWLDNKNTKLSQEVCDELKALKESDAADNANIRSGVQNIGTVVVEALTNAEREMRERVVLNKEILNSLCLATQKTADQISDLNNNVTAKQQNLFTQVQQITCDMDQQSINAQQQMIKEIEALSKGIKAFFATGGESNLKQKRRVEERLEILEARERELLKKSKDDEKYYEEIRAGCKSLNEELEDLKECVARLKDSSSTSQGTDNLRGD